SNNPSSRSSEVSRERGKGARYARSSTTFTATTRASPNRAAPSATIGALAIPARTPFTPRSSSRSMSTRARRSPGSPRTSAHTTPRSSTTNRGTSRNNTGVSSAVRSPSICKSGVQRQRMLMIHHYKYDVCLPAPPRRHHLHPQAHRLHPHPLSQPVQPPIETRRRRPRPDPHRSQVRVLRELHQRRPTLTGRSTQTHPLTPRAPYPRPYHHRESSRPQQLLSTLQPLPLRSRTRQH